MTHTFRRRKGVSGHRLCHEPLEQRLLLTTEVEPNDTAIIATEIVWADDEVELDGRISSATDIDFFEFNLAQGETLEVKPGSPTRTPGVELLDSQLRIQASSGDSEGFEFTSPTASNYFLKITGNKNHTRYTGAYEELELERDGFSGTSEFEPNNQIADANPLDDGVFRGRLSNSTDVDYFEFDADAGEAIVVAFAGRANEQPMIELIDQTDRRVIEAESGGIAYQFERDGTFRLRLSNPPGQLIDSYVGNFGIVENATLDVGSTSFANATPTTLSERVNLVGTLEQVDQPRWFVFDKGAFDKYEIELDFNGESLSLQSRTLSLYDASGRVIESTPDGGIDIGSIDSSLAAGRYYLSVAANHKNGLGAFAVEVDHDGTFSAHRDVATYFLDFDQHEPHLGYEPEGPLPTPAAIPHIVERVRGWFGNHEIDIVLEPIAGDEEVVSNGHGDFGSIGAAGYGAGSAGVRQPKGDSVTTVSGSIDDYDDGRIDVLIHEAGHATGMPHHRHPLAILGYDRDSNISPVGEIYTFSREPEDANEYRFNPRDYLDRVLTPGRQLSEADVAQYDILNDFIREMQVDITSVDEIELDARLIDVVEGDFDGNGWPDIAAADREGDRIVVSLNDGEGQLLAPDFVPVRDIAWWNEPLAVGDFNSDGFDDLVVVNNSTDSYQVLTGTPSGQLEIASSISLSASPASVAAADFNDDGRLDLAIGASGDLHILNGRGDATFATARRYDSPSTPYSISPVDLDGDGDLDIVTANQTNNSIASFINRDDGRFGSARRTSVGDSPFSVATADFNGDGIADVAVGDRFDEMVTLIYGDGDGTFSGRVDYEIGFGAFNVRSDDINLDGQPDLVIGNYDDALSLMLGANDGTLSHPILFPSDQQPAAVTVTDLNQDGLKDFVTANSFGRSMNVYHGITNDPRNDRVVVHGDIEQRNELDEYRYTATAGDRIVLDIDSAEFQSNLNAFLTIYDSAGTIVGQSGDAIDDDSGIRSTDPYLVHTVEADGEYTVRIQSEHDSAGSYRFKIANYDAIVQTGARLIHTDLAPTSRATRQILFWFSDQLDPKTLTSDNVQLEGATSGIHQGQIEFDPLRSLLIWQTDTQLPVDEYTFTIRSGEEGVTNLHGTPIDGELANSEFRFPDVSGDGTPGGDLKLEFRISVANGNPATVTDTDYERNPYNRSLFELDFSDTLDILDLHRDSLTIRGAGNDDRFDTADDTFPLFDPWMEVFDLRPNRINLYARGILDPGEYRVEGTISDAAGFEIEVSEVYSVGADYHGLSVIDVQELTNPEGLIEAISVRFNGSVDTDTLTLDNFGVQTTEDATFFNADDQFIVDADGEFEWVPALNQVTWRPATPLDSGSYQLVLRSGSDGIRDREGRLLDGEFLNAEVSGESSDFLWQRNPSGDGVPGGDYRELFSVVRPIDGDIDGTGSVDDVDLARVCRQLLIGQHESRFDLNGDGVFDLSDHEWLVSNGLGTGAGDANLDGAFNSSDLVQIFREGRFQSDRSATWQQGDWNCDGRFDTTDLVYAFATNPYSAAATPASQAAHDAKAKLRGERDLAATINQRRQLGQPDRSHFRDSKLPDGESLNREVRAGGTRERLAVVDQQISSFDLTQMPQTDGEANASEPPSTTIDAVLGSDDFELIYFA